MDLFAEQELLCDWVFCGGLPLFQTLKRKTGNEGIIYQSICFLLRGVIGRRGLWDLLEEGHRGVL